MFVKVKKDSMAKMNSNSKKKEADHLLLNKVANKPLNISDRLHTIVNDIENSLKSKENKISKLAKEVDRTFPPQSISRGLHDAFSAMSFDTAYSLYLLSNNSALVLELQGILERYCLNALNDMLPINDIAKSIISDAFDKKTLKDIAYYFKEWKLWNDDDVKFALDLTNLRNGIAHKNAELVSRSKLVNSNGQNRHPESIHSLMSKVDCSKYIVKTIGLIIKASGLATPSFIKQPRLHARYQLYTSLIGELYNLFLTNPYAQKGNPLLETYINERLAKVYIVGSEELVDYLQDYRKKVLLFHQSLEQGNEEESKMLHSEFGILLNNILTAMRKDLNIDFPHKEMLEEPSLIDIKQYLKTNKEMWSLHK